MSKSKPVVLIGAGGGSRDVLDILQACGREVIGFVVDPQYAQPGSVINGLPVLGGFEWLAQHANSVEIICGLGAPEHRFHLIRRARDLGATFCSVIHPSVVLTSRVDIGKGSSIAAGCVLTNNIRIGNHVQINIGCTISHDSVLEDFVTLSPGVHVAGNVTLQTGCFVGIGANIIEKKTIGAWSIVGAGSTITKDVPPNTTVVGVPGRVIKTRPEGWHLQ